MTEGYSYLISIISISSFLITWIIILYFSFKKFKTFLEREIISKTDYKSIIRLSWIYISLEIPYSTLIFIDYNKFIYLIEDLFLRPISLISNIIPVYILALLFYRKHFNSVRDLDEAKISTEEAVNRIFDSKSFYKAISTNLPIGKNDENFGFDYIPFMLQNLAEKRKRFQKSSRVFLLTTIGLSLVFVSITIFFGYILLNESSIGVYKALTNLNSEVESTDRILSSLKKDLSDNDYFKKNMSYDLEQLEKPYNYLKGSNVEMSRYVFGIKDAVENFNKFGDFNRLFSNVEAYRDSIIKSKEENGNNNSYKDVLNRVYNLLASFKKFRDNGITDLYSAQMEIKSILPQLQEEIKKPTNTQNELIKRLILSIVVISFFIAILRYFRGLYQSHYNEMLNAENEDLLIRKFYVSYKSSNSPDERKQVLSTFLAINRKPNVESTKRKDILDENAILKDVIGSILRKF